MRDRRSDKPYRLRARGLAAGALPEPRVARQAAAHRYRGDIDGLRAVAVVSVVLFHAGIPGFSGGFVGVDVFFVISGFLITGLILPEIEAGRFSLVHFYERRARRILPALFAVMAASALIGWVLMVPAEFTALAKSIGATALFASNVYFLLSDDYFAASAELRPLLHTWSLAVEEQFYIVWPLFLMLLAGSGRARLGRWIVVVLLLSLVGSAVLVFVEPRPSFYLLPTRAWELLAGGIIAAGIVPAWRTRLPGELAPVAGLAMIMASVVLYDATTPFPGLAALPPCLGTVLVIQSGGGTAAARALRWRPLVLVGLVSYSFYLWHWPLLAAARIVTGTVEPPIPVVLAMVAASFLLAIVSWRFIEQPFRRADAVGRTAIFALSGAGIAAALAGTLLVTAGNGLPGRFSDSLSAVALAGEDVDPNRRACMNLLPSGKPCVIGAEAREPTVLLWGDSHAAALVPAVGRALESAGLAGVVAWHSACPPLVDARRGTGWRSCADFVAGTVAALEDPASSIDTVVLAARWALYVSGRRAEGEAGEDIVFVAMDGTPSDKRELVSRSLSDLADRLRQAGVRRVILLGNVPEIGWHVPRTATARMRLHMAVPEGPLLAQVERRLGPSTELLATVAAAKGMAFVPLTPLLCDVSCRVMEGGRPLYSDDDHLSLYGAAEVLAPALSARLLPLLAGPDASPASARGD